VPIGADVIFHRGAPHGCAVGAAPLSRFSLLNIGVAGLATAACKLA
jgi:hypothetical protein